MFIAVFGLSLIVVDIAGFILAANLYHPIVRVSIAVDIAFKCFFLELPLLPSLARYYIYLSSAAPLLLLILILVVISTIFKSMTSFLVPSLLLYYV